MEKSYTFGFYSHMFEYMNKILKYINTFKLRLKSPTAQKSKPFTTSCKGT